MPTTPRPRFSPLTVIAQDPSVRHGGKIVRAQVDVPAEELSPGPCGYRVHVVDYDASTDKYYKPSMAGLDGDPFADASAIPTLRLPTRRPSTRVSPTSWHCSRSFRSKTSPG